MRRAAHDESVWSDVEAFANAMEREEAHLADTDLKAFLGDERALVTE